MSSGEDTERGAEPAEAVSALYRQQAKEEPPGRVDAAILREARRAVKRRPAVHGPFGSHWRVPVSLAAILLIVVGLVRFMPRDIYDTARRVPEAVLQGAGEAQSPLAREKREHPAEESARKRLPEAPPAPARQPQADLMEAPAGLQSAAEGKRPEYKAKAGTLMEEAVATAAETFGRRIRKIVKGMSGQEVLRLLGEPDRKKGDVWIYTAPKGGARRGGPGEYRIVFRERKVLRVEPEPDS